MAEPHDLARRAAERLSEDAGKLPPMRAHHDRVLRSIHRDRVENGKDERGNPRDTTHDWGIHHLRHDVRVVDHLVAHGYLEVANRVDGKGRPDPKGRHHLHSRITGKGYARILKRRAE